MASRAERQEPAAPAEPAGRQQEPQQEAPLERLVGRIAAALLPDDAPGCIVDTQGRVLRANAEFEAISKALADEVPGLGAAARPAGDEPGTVPGEVVVAVEALAAAAGRRLAVTVRGRVEHFTLRRVPLPGDDETILATAYIFTPVKEEAEAHRKLAAATGRLEDISRLVSDWIWETDRDLTLTAVSARVSEALGYHPLEIVGRRLHDLPQSPDAFLKGLSAASGRRPFRDHEVRIPDRQERLRCFLLSGLPVYCDESGDFLGFRGTASDITELRAREDALRLAKESAELANRTKSEFLASMSHELRTPLNAIIGFSEIMSNEMLGPIGTEQYKGYLGDITESARHLLVVINDILDVAKIESGQVALSEEPLDPETLARSVARLISPRSDEADITLSLDLPVDLPTLRGDKTKLKQILINLLSNAVKFTPEGGRVELRAALAENGDFLFVIEDTGIGMSEADIRIARTPFGQVDSRLSRRFEGTGLGLPLAEGLTEMHGGTFTIESQPGRGTTITVRLPAERVIKS